MITLNDIQRITTDKAERLINNAVKANKTAETDWAKNFWHGVFVKLCKKYNRTDLYNKHLHQVAKLQYLWYIINMKTINVTLKKKTVQEVYNQVKLCSDLGFPNFQKGEPINKLMREIKREVMKQKKQDKVVLWKELLDFWPLSIVVPAMLIAILVGPYFMR